MGLKGIPQQLKDLPNWNLWKVEKLPKPDKNGKETTKVPYQTNGFKASADKPSTWTTFDAVVKAWNNGDSNYDGIGFQFGNSPYCGYDQDHCIVDGVLTPLAQDIILKLDSYTELSQSGTGIHIIVEAKKLGKRCKNPKTGQEIYDEGRGFWITGVRIGSAPATIEARQDELNNVYNEIFPKVEEAPRVAPNPSLLTLNASEIVEKAENATNGSRFKQLYSGDLSGNGNDHSSADLALCNMLAFYTRDFYTIDDIFRSSGLYREKWDRKDYKSDTINEAISNCTATYDSSYNSTRKADTATASAKPDQTKPKTQINYSTAADFLKNGFMQELDQNKTERKVITGFPSLDKELGGHLYSGLYCIGAISSLGKTTFIAQIADHIASQGIDVLFFSLEMGKCEMICRSLTRDLFLSDTTANRNINMGHIIYGQISQEKLSPVVEAYQNKVGGNLYLIEGNFDVDVFTVKKIVEEHIEATGNKPVVIIDYLQVLRPVEKNMTDKSATDTNVIELKRLSRDKHIPVIAISSFNRSSYSTPVSYESFKESGGIEFTSDCVMGLELAVVSELDQGQAKAVANKERINQAKNADARDLKLIILKNRRGKAWASIPFKYYSQHYYFTEMESREHSSTIQKEKAKPSEAYKIVKGKSKKDLESELAVYTKVLGHDNLVVKPDGEVIDEENPFI